MRPHVPFSLPSTIHAEPFPLITHAQQKICESFKIKGYPCVTSADPAAYLALNDTGLKLFDNSKRSRNAVNIVDWVGDMTGRWVEGWGGDMMGRWVKGWGT